MTTIHREISTAERRGGTKCPERLNQTHQNQNGFGTQCNNIPTQVTCMRTLQPLSISMIIRLERYMHGTLTLCRADTCRSDHETPLKSTLGPRSNRLSKKTVRVPYRLARQPVHAAIHLMPVLARARRAPPDAAMLREGVRQGGSTRRAQQCR